MTDAGLFGPDSMAWRIHADPVMLVGGLRALLVQALEPRAMAAVDQHSKFREDPWGRLERTTNFVVTTTYGDTAAAEAAAALVRKVHEHVHGVDPVTGEAYAGNDPDLLLWIHAVEVESFVVAYRTYAGRLTDADADRYVAEMARVAELVELPAAMVPRSLGEVRDYLRSVRGLQVTPAAREGLRVVLFPPMDLRYRPLWAIPTTAAVAILPADARRMYRIPWFPPIALPVRTGVFALSRVLNLVTPVPPALRDARARVQSLAA
ncbi:MAG TPA: oxygenase MpaB family protein [Acidimicrobiia bacterium]